MAGAAVAETVSPVRAFMLDDTVWTGLLAEDQPNARTDK